MLENLTYTRDSIITVKLNQCTSKVEKVLEMIHPYEEAEFEICKSKRDVGSRLSKKKEMVKVISLVPAPCSVSPP